MPFIPTTAQNRKDMLKAIGVSDFEELLQDIPEHLRLAESLDLPESMSELEISRHIEELAGLNAHTGTHTCFLGGGAYDHFIPAAIDHLISRSEFYTSYTPYQPEVAQGNLQAIYEYQSMIAELTGMDVANASMYDGGSALAEAALLVCGHTGRSDILLSKSVHPYYREVVKTYCHRSGIQVKEIDIQNGITDISQLKKVCDTNTAGLLLQHPNFFGILEPVETAESIIHETRGLYVISADPISLGILKPPGEFGADVVTGEAQALGNSLNFGGPYVGLFAVTQALIRRLPGRLVGVTRDIQGRRGFVLTLQTREQHIRRDKATSSICTNEQLCALASAVYLALLGKKGLQKVAELCTQKAHYLVDQIQKIKGFSLMFNQPFFKEFLIQCPISPQEIIDRLLAEKLFAGINISRFDYQMDNALLIAVTEKRTRSDMDHFVNALKALV
jgi:glycine dehydrogenase subunit 1